MGWCYTVKFDKTNPNTNNMLLRKTYTLAVKLYALENG